MDNNKTERCITEVAATVLTLLGVEPDTQMAPPIPEVLDAAKEFDRPCDRVVLYNPDAIALWIYEKYAVYFQPMEKQTRLRLRMRSVMPSVTPACFGSMYSGVLPEVHGIRKYEKPVLRVTTIFDLLAKAGKKVAIVSTEGDSISMIFLERPIDYFVYPTKQECNEKVYELIREDRYDCIVLYNGDYDYEMHRHGPEGKKPLAALWENIETYCTLQKAIRENWPEHRTALVFAPDHGCHTVKRFFGNHGTDAPEDMYIPHFYTFLGREAE